MTKSHLASISRSNRIMTNVRFLPLMNKRVMGRKEERCYPITTSDMLDLLFFAASFSANPVHNLSNPHPMNTENVDVTSLPKVRHLDSEILHPYIGSAPVKMYTHSNHFIITTG